MYTNPDDITVNTQRTDIPRVYPNLLEAIRVVAGEEALVLWDRDVSNRAQGRPVISVDETYGDNSNNDWACFAGTLRIYFNGLGAVWKPEHRCWYVVHAPNEYMRVDAHLLREAVLDGELRLKIGADLQQEGQV